MGKSSREGRLVGVYSEVAAPVVAAYSNGRVDLLNDNLQVGDQIHVGGDGVAGVREV